jgi:cytosine/adenosine deaminase-related metal-dependent hydrolase
MNGQDVVQMAINNNAALAEMFWPSLTMGKLVEGAAADIIFVDYHATTPLSAGNLPWHIIFGFEADVVTTTIAAGKILMQDRQLLTLDEVAITARSRKLAAIVWERFDELSK